MAVRRSVTTVAKAGQSFDANWRAMKFSVLDKAAEIKEQFTSNPTVVSFQQWWAKTLVAPVMAVWGVYHAWQTVQLERYREFLGEETKREWAWKRHTENEWAMWKKVVNFVAVLLVSLMWQVLVPVSVTLALVAPMILSYIVWGNPIMSPIGLSILLISPLKFFPMVNWVWLI